MNYADFQTYMLERTWRVGDAAIITHFDTLVHNAEKAIMRTVKMYELTKTHNETITTNPWTLPSDYKELISLMIDGDTMYHQAATAAHNREEVAANLLSNQNSDRPGFSVIGDTIVFDRSISADNSAVITMDYYFELVPYITEPADPFRDEYPEIFDAAVAWQIYDFSKDAEGKAEQEKIFTSAAEALKQDQLRHQFPAGPMKIRLPGNVM